MIDIDYTLWPADGNLGNTKFPIPTNAEDWPTGDALVHNFVYQNGKLVGFVDTKALTVNESKSTTFPYDYVNIQVDKSLEGVMSFNKGERTKYLIITYTESDNTGDSITFKYKGCKTLDEITAVNENYMTTDVVDGVWSEPLWDLEDGSYMFQMCSGLTTFTSDLSSLTDGDDMFNWCSGLTTFTSDLCSLTSGVGMFNGCKLNTASVQNIADTINTYSGQINIGIGNSTPNAEETTAFNKMVDKGWTVYVNGSKYTPTSLATTTLDDATTTLDENGIETTTPIPFYAKPVASDKEHAQYIDSEGNFFNILGGQFIYGDDLSTYGMFTCEEDAAANMRLTKIVK